MLYEVLITGSAPWGFRISGGPEANKPTLISRLTPGGKADQSNVKIGDKLLAVNGRRISDLRLRKVMKLIQESDNRLHLTISRENSETKNEVKPTNAEISSFSFEDSNLNKELPRPKMRKSKLVSENETSDFVSESKTSSGTFENFDNVESSFLRQEDQLSSNQGSISEDVQFKPQVHWLHGKLRISSEKETKENLEGFSVKEALLKQPKSSIEMDEGYVSATIRNVQYNSPAGIYSENQILNTVVETAAAEKRSLPLNFRRLPVPVNKSSSVYKLVHNISDKRSLPVQSPSIQRLEAFHFDDRRRLEN